MIADGVALRQRGVGVLLHPTSLPSPHGIGDLGPGALEWIDLLADHGIGWWQFLPLGPPGVGDAPYQPTSAFAGNPLLISPQQLIEDGLVDRRELRRADDASDAVDFSAVASFKRILLERAWRIHATGAAPQLRAECDQFLHTSAAWLDDFALFMAIKESQGNQSWLDWPPELRMRDAAALHRARAALADAIDRVRFEQFMFFRQIERLRAYAAQRGLKIIGDVPIFVALDSADVWSHPELFLLDSERRPTVVAGVPPDYFSKTGQHWGNPQYDWSVHARTGYAWWTARMRAALAQADLVRIDHFRGFEAAWHIPAADATAERGRWAPGPSAAFFNALREALGSLPFIAEDLGFITPPVIALRDRFKLPGMRILQFAFGGGAEDTHLPHNYEPNCIVYTGTHDNPPTRGWYEQLSASDQTTIMRYLDRDIDDAGEITWPLIRLALASVARLAIIPLQDVLNLGLEARMNIPGSSSGSWRWRFQSFAEAEERLQRLGTLAAMFNRAAPGANSSIAPDGSRIGTAAESARTSKRTANEA